MDRHLPTRRSVLAASLAVPVLVASGAGPASATGTGRVPRTVQLPVGFRPEGITSGWGSLFWTGSLADGRLYRGNLGTGRGRVVAEGRTGKSLRGMQLDARSGLVWVTGNEGDLGTVYAHSAATGGLVRRVEVPGAVFLNDLVVTRDAVWVTDSSVDRLARLPLGRRGAPADGLTFLPLGGAWPTPDGLRANGIRELDDATLVVNNSTAGGLWAVPKRDGAVLPVEVRGGPGLTSGDGLELDGDRLYDVRGSGAAEVSVLRLRCVRGAWSATWLGALTDDTLSVPSTATRNGRSLWAVNARFGVVPDADAAEYYVTRLPARP